MATLGAVLTDVRDRIDETTAAHWTDAELRRWINEAAREVARRAEVLQDVEIVPIVAGTKDYTVTSDGVRIYRAIWIPDGTDLVYPLQYRDFRSLDEAGWTWFNDAQAWPAVFSLWGFPPNLTLTLFPTPSETGEIHLNYYRLPTALATDGVDDGEEVDLPSGWEDVLALYCEYTALRKDRDQRWRDAYQLFEQRLGEMVDRTRRWTDQAGAIDHAGTWVPSWLWDGGYGGYADGY